MNPEDYMKLAARTDHTEESLKLAMERMSEPEVFRMEHAIQGMATELGEFADIQKKYVNYGKPFDWYNAAEEIGDLLWYISLAVSIIKKYTGQDLSAIMETNVKKLMVRLPEKFDTDKAKVRDLDKERKILEGGENE